MDNIVYSYGGGEALFKVLNGVKMIFDSSLTTDLMHLMTFVGLAWAAFQGAQQNSWTPKLSWLIKYVLITSLFITPTATLVVSDSVTGYRKSVDGLPIGLVLPASVFSSIGFGITQLFDQAFSTVDGNVAYHKYGQSFGAALISQSRNFKIQDSGFRENMESFIDNCMLYDVMVGRKYNASELKDSDNIWNLVSRNASNIRMMNYRDENKSLGRKLVSCKEGVGLLNNYWVKDINKLGERFGSTIFGKYGSQMGQAISNSNQQVLGKSFLANVNVVSQLYGNTGDASKTLKQIMMINAVADIPLSYGAVRAKQQQQESWLISGQLAREILPTLHAIFAALIYASFTLIIGMLVLPNGFRTLANYFGLLIWIETWPPLFAVINLLTNISSKTYGGDFTGITMNSASQIISHNNNISVVASGMMIVLPYLSYNILKGGAGQFVHLANQVMGSSQSSAMAASGEVTSGNRSLDNVSMMNGQWSNNSGFKTDMNMSYRSGHREHQLADGTMVKETASGNTILQSGPGLTHSVGAKSMHMAFSDSSQTHQSLSKEQSELVENRKEYDQTKQTMQRQSIELVNRLAAGEASGEHYSYNHSTGSGKILNSAIASSKELHDSHAYNNSQATEGTIKGNIGGSLAKSFGSIKKSSQGISDSIKTGTVDPTLNVSGDSSTHGEKAPQGLWGSIKDGVLGAAALNVGIDLSASGKIDSMNIQGLTEDKGASVNTNVTKQTEDIARAAKDIQFSETQTEEKALADSLAGSYEHMQQLRDSISVSEQKIERYQTSKDNSQSSSFTVSDDMYHKELEFITSQRDSNGFKIGAIKAKNIIDEGGATYKEYHHAYQSKYLPQQKMITPSFNHEKTANNNIPQNIDFKGDYTEVSEFSNDRMESNGGVVPDAKVIVDRQHKSAVNKISLAEQKILRNGEEVQKQIDLKEDERYSFSAGRDKNKGQKFTDH